MDDNAMQGWPRVRRIAGFVVGGGLNTAVTYLLYLALHLQLGYHLAFLLAYMAGILFSYWFNSTFVFKKAMSWRGLLAFPLVYVVQYAVSALVLVLLVEQGGVAEWLAPLLVSAIMLPLTYVMVKFVLHRYNR
jgi:putative flippase GtrA